MVNLSGCFMNSLHWIIIDVFLCLCRCLRPCKLKIQCCTTYVMCEQKFFTYNYFHSIFPVVFASRTNLFLFTTFRSSKPIQYRYRLRPELKTSDLVASRTQNISLLKYLATYLTFWISFFRNYQSFL